MSLQHLDALPPAPKPLLTLVSFKKRHGRPQAVLNRRSTMLIRRSRTKPTKPMVMMQRMMCS